jgi:hypothetical protein
MRHGPNRITIGNAMSEPRAIPKFESFEEFWPFYLKEHSDPVNRALHYAGTSMAIGTVVVAGVTLNPWWLLATPVVGYGPAWIGHFFIEKNKPASFKHPVWSFRGDIKMLGLALRGRIREEFERIHAASSSTNGAHHVNGEAVAAS